MIRILIADDHLLFRSMLEEMLKRDEAFKIIASCASGEAALAFCHKEVPDIALLDIGMPSMGGIETLKALKLACPQMKVVMLTTFEDAENIHFAVQFGADGYLIKDMMPETLMLALKCIQNNIVLFHQAPYQFLKAAIAGSQESREKTVQINNMIFDAVDIKILQLIVQGKSNKEIGVLLNYSEGTIKNKISKILSITGFSGRTELSVFAINHELV